MEKKWLWKSRWCNWDLLGEGSAWSALGKTFVEHHPGFPQLHLLWSTLDLTSVTFLVCRDINRVKLMVISAKASRELHNPQAKILHATYAPLFIFHSQSSCLIAALPPQEQHHSLVAIWTSPVERSLMENFNVWYKKNQHNNTTVFMILWSGRSGNVAKMPLGDLVGFELINEKVMILMLYSR